MIHANTIAVARRLWKPISELDCIVVPLAQGGKDTNGRWIADEAAMTSRMAEKLELARLAIVEAQAILKSSLPNDDDRRLCRLEIVEAKETLKG